MSDETRDGRLIWIDLEMSGLDPDREHILEIASVVTDQELTVVAEGPSLVIHQPNAVLEAMDEWNQRHHGASGLTDRVRASSTSLADAERQTLEFLAAHATEGAAPLAGNSVHQDRLFLVKYMPTLHGFLHYRNVDVTTIKELARRWAPGTFDARPRKKASHRAHGDILESIEELRYYRTAFFVAPAAS
ncbi:MAG: oligoribonuclease [Sandaracinaceae bacterium]